MSDELLKSAWNLKMTTPERLWGVSAESVYLALAAVATTQSTREGVEPCYRASVLSTNDKRPRSEYAEFHDRFLAELDLTSGGRLTDLGRVVCAAEDPLSIVRQVVILKFPRLRSLLRDLSTEESETLTRREFNSLLRDQYDEILTAPLVASMGLGFVDPDGYVPGRHQPEERVLFDTDAPEVPSAAWDTAVIRSTTGIETPQILIRIVEGLEGDDAVDPEVCEVPLSRLVRSQNAEHNRRTELSDIEVAVSTVSDSLESETERLHELLDAGRSSITDSSTQVSLESILGAHEVIEDSVGKFVRDVLWTCAERGVTAIPTRFISDRLGTTHYDTYRIVSAVPGVSCSLTHTEMDHILTFDTIPDVEDGTDRWKDIVSFLVERIHTLEDFQKQLNETIVEERVSARNDVSAMRFERIDESVIEPTYFAYTLPDPSALGDAKMDRFVGSSEALSRERAKLNRWSDTETADSRRFTELTDRLVSKGLEEDLDERVLRIMTPYDDDTFSEYASQFRQLVREGYEIRLLTRHTRKKWQWERLRDNLIGELESNRSNVTIRTYSRYKEYQRITGDTDLRDLGEFGIHAKLQTIGHAEEGAALLGSANFMENSYDWNPECGVYTKNANFVTAALEFFDFVWDLASADEVDLDRLQEIPNREYYPSYYT